MATLIELAESGHLHKFDTGDEVTAPPERLIYVRTNVLDWINNALPSLQPVWKVEIQPIEQLYALFEDFLLGRPIVIGRQMHILHHHGAGIWELKTPDIRIFGWFPCKDCFVVTDIDCATRVKTHKLYAGYRDQGVHFRDHLALDEPKFIEGDDPYDVISNPRFPPP